jgi:vancomycin resistance protein VanJ
MSPSRSMSISRMRVAVARRLPAVREMAFAAAVILEAFWLVGQIARDDLWITGLCFYIPSAFLAATFLSFSLIYAACRRPRRAFLAAAISLPPLGFVGFVENQFFRPLPSMRPDALRVVHWNTGGALDRSETRSVLLAQHADLYVLSEIGDRQSVRLLKEALGQHYQARVFDGMAVVGKGDLRSKGWVLRGKQAKVRTVHWEHVGRSVTLFVADLPSDLDLARAPMLEQVMTRVEQFRPDIVIGDFNAPRRSRALANLPAGYRHAYNTCGKGLSYTWPIPIPMYSLDQCILAPRVTPIRYGLLRSLQSDHCLQVFDFWIPRGPGG